MKCHECQIASDEAVALSKEARAAMHRRCPGAYRTPQNRIRPCDCLHHRAHPVDLVEAAKGRLPILDPSDGGQDPDRGQRPKKGQKAPQRGTSDALVGRRCECCGARCQSRFLPGHDAKLKSKLFRQAKTGNWRAALELEARGWLRLVKYEQIPEPALERALVQAKQRPHAVIVKECVLDRIGSLELRSGNPS